MAIAGVKAWNSLASCFVVGCPETPALCPILCKASPTNELSGSRPAQQWYGRRAGQLAAATKVSEVTQELVEAPEDSGAELVNFLKGLGFENEEADRIQRKGRLAESRVSTLKERAAALRSLPFTNEELTLLICRDPNLLNSSAKTLAASFGNLQDLFGLTPLQVKEAVIKNPTSLALPKALSEVVPLLLDLGLSKAEIGEVFCRHPRSLPFVKGNRGELVALGELGFSKQEIAAAIKKHPRLLGSKVARNYRKLVEAMAEHYGVDAETCKRLALAFPAYLCLNTATMIPKVDYLVRVMGRDVSELLSYPPYIGLSLKERIEPRYRACVKDGTAHLGLSRMLACSDATFEEQMQKRREKARQATKA